MDILCVLLLLESCVGFIKCEYDVKIKQCGKKIAADM